MKHASSGAVFVVASLTAQGASAQLEEILVTAERREATQLTTAISVEVFNADDLAVDRLQTVNDLQEATPNLTVNFSGFTVQSVNIRGVGNSVVNPNIQPGVAVFQDGMLMAETVVIQQGFLDIDTIEVLRGPQGTFVGQSSTGGAIRINSKRPDFDSINGFVDVLLGNERDQQLTGAINLPLAEKVAARFAFNQERRDSYFDNLFNRGGLPPYESGPQPGKVDDLNMRASFLWEPNPALSVLGRIELNSSETDHTAVYQPNRATFANPFDPTGIGRAQYASFAEPGNDPYRIAYDVPDVQNTNESNRYSVDVRYRFDSGMEFRSMTGFQYNNLRVVEDQDGSRANGQVLRNNVGPNNNHNGQEFDLLSPEGKRLSWIVGTSWFHRHTPVHLRADNNNCGYNSATGAVAPCPAPGALPAIAAVVTIDTIQRHAGVFGQITYDISDKLELEVGARNSWDNNIDTQTVYVGILGPPPSACPGNPDATNALPAQATYLCINASSPNPRTKFKDTTPTYKVGLNWTPTDNQFIYGFFSRGYKSGGSNNTLRFEPELVDDFEIGWKAQLLDSRMQVQLGAFYMDYSQMQTQAFYVRPSTSGGLSNGAAIVNIGDSTIDGFELSINAAFGGLGIDFSAGYTNSDLGGVTTVDARYLNPNLFLGNGNWVPGCVAGQTPVVGAGGVPSCFDYRNSAAWRELSGSDNVYSPNLSYNLAVDYGFALEHGATLRPRIAFSHSDSSFASLFQSDNFYRIDERDFVNVSLSYEAPEWELQAYCNNCSDEVLIAGVGDVTGYRVVYGDPRSVGVRFRKSF
jgi:iron complex outermembrane recepter protein